ncbi:bromodomain-containing protein 8 [Cuculus canorus]|uniref:bromodomain-containing protein 8 n=1 Tax=Cuculus canorus TaxID=55661 RepID=UPI0023AACAC8|nr:bromodomain-containing protein 8 [Cuculus canorus]
MLAAAGSSCNEQLCSFLTHNLQKTDSLQLRPERLLPRLTGHCWVWWESEMESLSESEKNSNFQSLLSWDSGLDLDIGSWRNTEEVALWKLEESSEEADHELELSETLCEDNSDDNQKAERACEDDSLLQLFSEVTQMMEPLYISSPKSSQIQQDYCGSGKQSGEEDVRCREKTTGTAVLGAKESQLRILAEDEHFLQREDKTQENPEEQAVGEVHSQEMTNEAPDQYDSDSASAAPVLDSTSPANMQLVQLSWDHPLQHLLFKRTLLSIWKIIASHRCSGPFLKAVSEKQAPGYSDVVKRPMDLTSIKKRLSKGHIQSVIQFQRDLMLMFQNAIMYNSFNHHVHRMATDMQREVLEQLQMLCEAVLCSRDWLG